MSYRDPWNAMTNITSKVASQNENTTLLGETKQDYASIVRWMSFSNSEILSHIGPWYRQVVGKHPYDKDFVENAKVEGLRSINVLEQYFQDRSFFVKDRVTLADLYVASQMTRAFESLLDRAWREQNPNTTRWFRAVTSQAIWKAVSDEVVMIEKAIEYTPPEE